MKKLRYIAALLLIASLVLSPFTPVSAVSAEVGEEEAVRIGEVESLRETNSETYLMSDGTYECVVYAEDKYYRDSNNALQLIDNTLVAAGSGTGLMAAAQYTNAANAFEITLSGSGTPQVSMNYNGVGVVFFPIGASKQGVMHMTASDTVVAIGGVENCSTLSQLTATGSNTAAYANVFGSADLVYVLENDALKEYIILKDSSAPNEFSFLFELDGLTMQTVDGFTHFVNGNEESVFTLGSLFAVDANGKPTDALTYDFVPVKGNDGQVIVTVTLSEDYLSDPDRAFPVVIDPTVTISSSQTADTCVCEGFPSTNYYTAVQLRTGYDSDYGRRRSYLRFDIPDSIAPGSVTNATLDMERVSGAIPTTRAYRVTAAWTSSTLTWNNSPVYTTLGQSTQSVVFREGSAWYTMNVTQIVQSWVNGNYLNHGFVVIDANESDPDHWTTWYSSEANSPHKPELIITYDADRTGITLSDVPNNIKSTASHLCIPCAITNIAAYWSVNGYSQFNCNTAAKQESAAVSVQAAMNNAGSATANAYIQDGFAIFNHQLGLKKYGLQATNLWRSNNAFSYEDIVEEISAGRPLLLGFAGTSDSPFGGAHMTACAGYLIDGGTEYIIVSDAHNSFLRQIKFNIETYNDFIAKVVIYEK